MIGVVGPEPDDRPSFRATPRTDSSTSSSETALANVATYFSDSSPPSPPSPSPSTPSSPETSSAHAYDTSLDTSFELETSLHSSADTWTDSFTHASPDGIYDQVLREIGMEDYQQRSVLRFMCEMDGRGMETLMGRFAGRGMKIKVWGGEGLVFVELATGPTHGLMQGEFGKAIDRELEAIFPLGAISPFTDAKLGAGNKQPDLSYGPSSRRGSGRTRIAVLLEIMVAQSLRDLILKLKYWFQVADLNRVVTIDVQGKDSNKITIVVTQYVRGPDAFIPDPNYPAITFIDGAFSDVRIPSSAFTDDPYPQMPDLVLSADSFYQRGWNGILQDELAERAVKRAARLQAEKEMRAAKKAAKEARQREEQQAMEVDEA